MQNYILFIGGSETLIIVLAVILLFGAKSIPDIARTIGKATREFNKASEQIKKEIREAENNLVEEDEDVKELINQEKQEQTKAEEQ